MARKMYIENRGGYFFLHSKKPSYKLSQGGWRSRDALKIDWDFARILCGTIRDMPKAGDVLVIEYYWTRELTMGRTLRNAELDSAISRDARRGSR